MSSTVVGPPAAAGGGPRRAAEIFDATLRLLAEHGYDGLTIEGVADRAGVNKTTIYRWWPSKPALLGAALRQARLLDFSVPDTGTLGGDLEALVSHLLGLLTTHPTADVATAALASAVRTPELAEQAKAFFGDRLKRELPVFERAVARGELPPDADPVLLMDLLAGAVWVRVVFRQAAAEADFARRVVDVVLTGAQPSG